MKAKDLIGKKVTRIAPAECRYGKDGSYMGEISIIVNADDNLIMITNDSGVLEGHTHTLSTEWCDDNWICVEEFLKQADENLLKLQAVKSMINNINDLDIGSETKNGVQYITKLEDFRDLVDENTYVALIEFVNKCSYNYQEIIDDLKSDINRLQDDYDLLDIDYDNIDSELENLRSTVEEIVAKNLSKEEIVQELKKYIN